MKHLLSILLICSIGFSQEICHLYSFFSGSNLMSFPILNDSILTYSDLISDINSQIDSEVYFDSTYANNLIHHNSSFWISSYEPFEYEICGIPSDPCISFNFDNSIDSTNQSYSYSFPVLVDPTGNIDSNLSLFVEQVGLNQISSQGGATIYDPFFGWVGSIVSINYNSAYYFQVSNPQVVQYCGYPYNYEQMGDINQDGSIIIDDIIWTLNHIIGSEELNSYGKWAANLSFDYNIDVFDIIKMVSLSF